MKTKLSKQKCRGNGTSNSTETAITGLKPYEDTR